MNVIDEEDYSLAICDACNGTVRARSVFFPGYYTSGWILVSASAHLERPNAVNYRLVTSEGQPLHVDAGLLDVGKKIIKDSWDYNDAEDDDE